LTENWHPPSTPITENLLDRKMLPDERKKTPNNQCFSATC